MTGFYWYIFKIFSLGSWFWRTSINFTDKCDMCRQKCPSVYEFLFIRLNDKEPWWRPIFWWNFIIFSLDDRIRRLFPVLWLRPFKFNKLTTICDWNKSCILDLLDLSIFLEWFSLIFFKQKTKCMTINSTVRW